LINLAQKRIGINDQPPIVSWRLLSRLEFDSPLFKRQPRPTRYGLEYWGRQVRLVAEEKRNLVSDRRNGCCGSAFQLTLNTDDPLLARS